jgi:hypothetical protein
MYLMARLHDQGRKLLALRAVRNEADLVAAKEGLKLL